MYEDNEVISETQINITEEDRHTSRVSVLMAAALVMLLLCSITAGLLIANRPVKTHVVNHTHVVTVYKVRVAKEAPKGLWWLGRMAQSKNELGFIAGWKVAALKGGNHVWYCELVAREEHFTAQLAWQTARYEAIVHRH